MTATILYEGNLRCNATHLQSGNTIETDAPSDNRGKGERFSPTDLLCTSLATCMITTMAIKATDMGIELKGAEISIKKHMIADPRRVGKVDVILTFPRTLMLEEKDKIVLQRVGDHCPVMQSLSPNVEISAVYNW